MRSTHFVDSDVYEELRKRIPGNESSEEDSDSLFPEHSFIATCLRIGLKIEDLKSFTYVDILKIIISYLGNSNEENNYKEYRDATQEDIDRLLA